MNLEDIVFTVNGVEMKHEFDMLSKTVTVFVPKEIADTSFQVHARQKESKIGPKQTGFDDVDYNLRG